MMTTQKGTYHNMIISTYIDITAYLVLPFRLFIHRLFSPSDTLYGLNDLQKLRNTITRPLFLNNSIR